MWDQALALLDEAERHHRRFFALADAYSAHSQARPTWEPPVDVFENAGSVWIFVALPGAKADQVSVHVEDAALVVRAERALPHAIQAVRVRRLEIPYGLFERRIVLPPGHYQLHEQRVVDGCLELRLSRA